jgi:hypothetical protein
MRYEPDSAHSLGQELHNPLDGLDAPRCWMSRLTLLSLMPYRMPNFRFGSRSEAR